MRIFVLASLSTTMIAASSNAGSLPAKSNAPGNNAATDGSPFDAMLTTASQQPQQQTAKSSSSDDSNPPPAQNNSVPASTTDNQDSASTNIVPAGIFGGKMAGDSAATSAGLATAKVNKNGSAANDNSGTDATAAALPPAGQPAPQTDINAQAVTEAQSAQLAAQIQAALTAPAATPAGTSASDDSGDNDAGAVAAAAISGSSGTPMGQTLANGAAPVTANADSKNQIAAGSPAANPSADSTAANGDFPQALALNTPPGGKNLPATQASVKNVGGNGKPAVNLASASAAPSTATPAPGSAPQSQTSEAQAKQTAQPGQSGPLDQSGQSQQPGQPQLSQAEQAQLQQSQPQPQSPSDAATSLAGGAAINPAVPGQSAGAVSTSVHVAAQAGDTAATVNSLAVSIAAKTQSGARQFDIRLDPPELGRVEVRLSIDASGKTEAHMTADQPETLNLLQRDSGSLTQALRSAGLDVSQSGLNFSLRGQGGQAGGDSDRSRGSHSNLTASRAIDAAQGTASAISFTGAAGDGRLDIHV